MEKTGRIAHLIILLNFYQRFDLAGSYENEVLAVDFIRRQLTAIQQRAKPIHKITIDLQKPRGSFNLEFADGMTHHYRNIQNIIAKLESGHGGKHALLINCHFDSVPQSPGWSLDDRCWSIISILILHDIIFHTSCYAYRVATGSSLSTCGLKKFGPLSTWRRVDQADESWSFKQVCQLYLNPFYKMTCASYETALHLLRKHHKTFEMASASSKMTSRFCIIFCFELSLEELKRCHCFPNLNETSPFVNTSNRSWPPLASGGIRKRSSTPLRICHWSGNISGWRHSG